MNSTQFKSFLEGLPVGTVSDTEATTELLQSKSSFLDALKTGSSLTMVVALTSDTSDTKDVKVTYTINLDEGKEG